MRLVRFCLAFCLASALAYAEGAIGVMFMGDPSPGMLAHFGGVNEGVVVTDTVEGGPAHKAGLKLGDVIVAVDSKSVEDFDELSKLVGKHAPGETVEITFRRHKEQADGHDEKTVTVGVVDREAFWKAELERQKLEQKP